MDWIRSLSTWGLKKSVVAVVSISAVLVSFISNTSTVCPFPAIYNFGDSNSDTGAVSAAFGQVPPPNGDTFFGRPSGRQSDGRLIIDFIGQTQRQKPLLAATDFGFQLNVFVLVWLQLIS